ncbi:DUF4097 family beta strand repeat-containing protein [Fodinicola feengrottensis]
MSPADPERPSRDSATPAGCANNRQPHHDGTAMPIFQTPEPILAVIEIVEGDVRIAASDRTDTVVEVRPHDESKEADVRTATQTRVEYADGRLLVKTPNSRGLLFTAKGGAVDVTLSLPTGSTLEAKTAAGLHSQGRLGETKLTSATGDIWLDQVGKLRLNTADGEIRVRTIDGSGSINTADGDIIVGDVTGDVRLHTADGSITVDSALADVTARTANGSIRIGEVVRGTVTVTTAAGELEVGVREGTAVWLDANSWSGDLINSMDEADGPQESDETVKVRARTYSGDIIIHRS